MRLLESDCGLNVLLLAGGQSDSAADDGNYPLCLTEIEGAPLLQHVVHACADVGVKRLIAAFKKSDINAFHLDSVVRVLSSSAVVVSAESDTAGAACTALLAIAHIDNDEELLIVNGNELLDVNYRTVVASFRERNLDAGTVTFASVHPRYSYVRLSEEELVVEAAEKRPISRHATVGFYWFARGRDFVRSAQAMIQKDAAVNSNFYICPVLNEMILEQKRIGTFPVEASQYRPLKTARQIMRRETLERRDQP
jgi:NDP-sugar pyrophosphorylase family protein